VTSLLTCSYIWPVHKEYLSTAQCFYRLVNSSVRSKYWRERSNCKTNGSKSITCQPLWIFSGTPCRSACMALSTAYLAYTEQCLAKAQTNIVHSNSCLLWARRPWMQSLLKCNQLKTCFESKSKAPFTHTRVRVRDLVHEYEKTWNPRHTYVKCSHRDEFRTSPSSMRFLLVRVQFAWVVFLGSSSEFCCLFTLRHLICHT